MQNKLDGTTTAKDRILIDSNLSKLDFFKRVESGLKEGACRLEIVIKSEKINEGITNYW